MARWKRSPSPSKQSAAEANGDNDYDALHAAADAGSGTLDGGDGVPVLHLRRAPPVGGAPPAAGVSATSDVGGGGCTGTNASSATAPPPPAMIPYDASSSAADWFSPMGVHRLERQVVPHFFSGKFPGHTAERYMMLRNRVIAKYLENPVKRIGFSECQGLVTSTAELDDLSTIVWFLDTWGIINYFAVGPEYVESIKMELRMVNSLIREDPTRELHLMSDPSKSIDCLVLFDQPKCNIRADIASAASTLSSPKMTNGEAGIIDLNDPGMLSYISIPPPLMEGRHDGSVVKQFLNKLLIVPWQSDWFLPTTVHRLERQGLPHLFAGKSPVYTPQKYMMLRNRGVDGKKDGPENDGDRWTYLESLPLLEGMDIYDENWNAIVEQVGTKSEVQCFHHFPWLSNCNGSTSGSFLQISEAGHLPFINTANPIISLGEFDQQETGKSKKGLSYLSSEKMEEYLQRNEDKQDEIRLNIANLIRAESERKNQLKLEDILQEIKQRELVEEKRQQRLEDIIQELKGKELVEEKRQQRLEDIIQELKGKELVEEKRQQRLEDIMQELKGRELVEEKRQQLTEDMSADLKATLLKSEEVARYMKDMST
uniref:SWIRM domain-containing protein n=1 Tax=Oryza punctata TaxID=4537 RepID=A0A0E0MK99_ORYPU